MTLKGRLFSFKGRIDRRRFWLSIVPVFIGVHLFAVAPFLIAEIVGGTQSDEMPYSFMIAIFVAYVVWFAGLWPMFAIGSKRLHDRNRRGWWLIVWWVLPFVLFFGGWGIAFTSRSGETSTGVFLMIASLPLALWGIVELGILKGTIGPNTYGADPAQPQP